MTRIFALFFINLFVFFSLAIRFLGMFLAASSSSGNNYFAYIKLAKQNMHEDVHAVIIIPEKKVRVIKIYKKPIGAINKIQAIDTFGNLFKTDTSFLISVQGDYKKWPALYDKLEKFQILPFVYKVNIRSFHIELWMLPKTLILLTCIEDLASFYALYPEFFLANKKIDLTDTKRIAISEFAVALKPKTENVNETKPKIEIGKIDQLEKISLKKTFAKTITTKNSVTLKES